MQHAHSIPPSFPWRAATLVVGAIAALELLALIGIGVIHLAPKRQAAAVTHPAAPTVAHTKPKPAVPRVPSHPLRPRSAVHVLVLNGNGVQGAAAAEASHLRVTGYRIGGARNAARHNYAHSMVLYVPGWIKEARRLARDSGVRLVAPVDGLRPSALRGSKLVVILGSA